MQKAMENKIMKIRSKIEERQFGLGAKAPG